MMTLARETVSSPGGMSGGSQVKTLVPVRVQSPLAHACRLGLLAINRSNRERIGKACSCQSAAVFAEDEGNVRKTSRL